MLVKELPKQISDKTFTNLNELFTFVYENQLITEFWELENCNVTNIMKNNLEKAKLLDDSNFINL